ncbi:MAG: hypothetical protein HC809_14400 [Gammaproteobacteria bacterium]|nr:hypothetical protein [Gammaproteobacteria bacterium]
MTASDLTSPWVSGTNLVMDVRVFPDRHATSVLQMESHLTLEDAVLPWGRAEQFNLLLHGEPSLEGLIPATMNVGLELYNMQSPWGRSRVTVLSARSTLLPGDATMRTTDFQLHHENLLTSWGGCVEADVSGQIAQFQEQAALTHQ